MVALGADSFRTAAKLQRSWIKRPLRKLRKRTALLRCAVLAPISAERQTRLAWLLEESRWRAASVPVMDVVRAFFHIEETGSFYIPVQKAGCTSMIAALRQGAEAGGKITAPVGNAHWRNPLHLGSVPEDFRSGARIAFTVVRHPVSRFWSAYNHLVVQAGDDRIARVVRDSLGLPSDRSITPDVVLEYVGTEPIDDLYFAFRPQFAVCGAEMLPIKIARLENLMMDLGVFVAEGLLPQNFLQRIRKLNIRGSEDVHQRYRGLDRRIAATYSRDMNVFGYS